MEVRHSHVALLPSVKFYSVPPHSPEWPGESDAIASENALYSCLGSHSGAVQSGAVGYLETLKVWFSILLFLRATPNVAVVKYHTLKADINAAKTKGRAPFDSNYHNIM